jgi:hypothetical protein
MNRDDIIQMAREAGGFLGELPRGDAWLFLEEEYLERFAALVASAEREFYDDLLHSIKSWSEAYPLSVFPEPDLAKAHEVLRANGMTLDAISASNMRHVITQVQSMIDKTIRARGQA